MDQLHRRGRELRVSGDVDQQLRGSGTAFVRRRRRRRAILHRAERVADRRFHLPRVDVADDDDRHPLRAIPRVVKRPQSLDGGRAHDLRFPDRQAIRVVRLEEEHWELPVANARARAEPATPLFDHDAALFFDFLRNEALAARRSLRAPSVRG